MIKKYVFCLNLCISSFWPLPVFLHNSLASIFIQANCAAPFGSPYRQPIFKLNKTYSSSRFSNVFNGWHINNLVPVTGDSSIFNSSHQQLPIYLLKVPRIHPLCLCPCHWLWVKVWPVLPDYFNCLLMLQLPSHFPVSFPSVFSSNCKQNGIPKNQIWCHSYLNSSMASIGQSRKSLLLKLIHMVLAYLLISSPGPSHHTL